MGLTSVELARQLDVDPETVRNQERAKKPRRLYLLAASRVEDIKAERSSASLDAMRQTMRAISELAEKGSKL